MVKSGDHSSESEDTEVDDDELENGEVYVVEVITAARVAEDEDGEVGWQYFVKWANYPDSASSWEPAANVQGCKDLLRDFWGHVGNDDKDYEIGYRINAKKQWINKKKEFFKKTFMRESRNETKNEKNRKVSFSDDAKPAQPEKSSKGILKWSKPVIDLSDDDDIPLAKRFKSEHQVVSTAQKRGHVSGEETLPKTKFHAESDVENAPSSSKDNDANLLRTQSLIDDLFSSRESSPKPSVNSQSRSGNAAQSTALHPKSVPTPTYPAQSTAGITTRPDKKGEPLHRHRKNNPQVKLIDLSPKKISRGSTLSTKARVVQPQPVVPVSRPTLPNRKSLSHLNFKKNIPKPLAPPVEAMKLSPVPQSGNRGPDTAIDEPRISDPTPPSPISDSLPEPHVHTDRDQQAEDFLLRIMPEGLSAPLKPSDEMDGTVLPKVKPAAMGKIQKKWKWSGELFISMSADKAERLCNVTINNSTECRADGLRLGFFFQKRDSVLLKKLHDITDLNLILPSFGSAHQFARLVPQEGKDKDALSTLSSYMSSRRKFTYSPLFYSNEVAIETEIAAFMFIFPLLDEVCSLFDVPDDMRQHDGGEGILVALLPLKLKSTKYQELRWYSSTWPVSTMEGEDFISLPHKFLKSDPAYARALRILDFPQWLHDFIPGRQYCVWFAPVDGTQEEHGMKIQGSLQTQALATILDRTQAKNVGYKSNLRVVFVHVGALKTLHLLPAFSERKLRFPELQFITYGTHPTVPEHRWGIRELYTVGGIVTFTPLAIVNDPYSVLKLISKIHGHPLWECYILPSVLGLAMCTAQQIEDAWACDLISEDLCRAIEDGEIALMEAPHTDPHPWMDVSRDLAWVRQQQSFPREPTTLLAKRYNKEWYNKKYSGDSQISWQSAIVEDISKNMFAMSLQPTFMDNYRRFVVITDPTDAKVNLVDPADPTKAEPAFNNWLEWQTLISFSFKDSYV